MISRFRPEVKSPTFMVLTWLLVFACATTDELPAGKTDQPASAAVIVNHSRLDVRVYVTGAGTRDLLGFVTSGSIQRYAIDPDIVRAAWLTLIADPVGSTEIIETDSFVLRPGDVVEWTIRPRSENSSFIIY
jgi:hypothetical protein